MSTVKITRNQIRELVLNEQARRGGTVEAIVDEILMTAPTKKERLDYNLFGLKALQFN